MTSTHLKIETISHSSSEFETEVGVDDINKVEETRPDEIEIIEGQSPTKANHLEVKKRTKGLPYFSALFVSSVPQQS